MSSSLAALLDVRPAPAPLLVTPAHVGGRVAWADLRRSGVLVELYDGAGVGAGTVVEPRHRAPALARVVPSRCVLAAATAAWVHTGWYAGGPAATWPPGAPVEVAYAPGTHCPTARPGLLVRRTPGLASDTVRLAGVAVTSLTRTAVDVARTVGAEAAVPLLVALAGRGADLRRAARLLDQRARVVGRPAAHRALAAARELLGR
ncbi:hypothetical protein ACFQHV_04700 [Promicromonospora thailandica]|uniref:Transcriptional regulator with AbiEi antitoxin domain of type IV toxin-antitoxin system n=1 Tax=Promicromonospora thailandica TaxID=765201 RepID=A0A9X2G2F6_9MICO|nr:hypothetical protein [Promicromonospora thailandica]MCP2265825.1 hypothetical protein [Promicromonospora thailandica]BFF21854.1 hypothetical protein GCM10025730_53750 [Promicromonospora thailandica]